MRNNPFQKVGLLMLFALICAAFASCQKLAVNPNALSNVSPAKSLDTIKYQWGDMSINRGNATDVIRYDNAGKIGSISNTDFEGQKSVINFTYKDNKIILDTKYNDVYELDDNGRVTSHSVLHTEDPTFKFYNVEQYYYDGNGYLSRIRMSLQGISYAFNTTVSIITYQVQNGNYTSYTLADSTGANITRQYNFQYASTNVNSSFSFFSPVLGDNTYVAIEKYLNFGKQSVNLLSGINFTLGLEGGGTQTGTLTVNSQIDAQGNVRSMSLVGDEITGEPLDNLSPLPRAVIFSYNK